MSESEEGGGEIKLRFRIEQLPDGTFAGRSEDPKVEVKGATPQEVQRKIEQMTSSGILKRLGVDFSTSISGPGIEVTLKQREPSATPGVEVSGREPLTSAPFDATSFRPQQILKTLLAVGALVYFAMLVFQC